MSDPLRTFDQGLAVVIIEAHRFGFSVKSNFAREHADYIAMAASMGLVSTRVFANIYSREWRPTVDGLKFLQTIDFEWDEE
jgi:hypothetical protein